MRCKRVKEIRKMVYDDSYYGKLVDEEEDSIGLRKYTYKKMKQCTKGVTSKTYWAYWILPGAIANQYLLRKSRLSNYEKY